MEARNADDPWLEVRVICNVSQETAAALPLPHLSVASM
jgi:hypothetical protein